MKKGQRVYTELEWHEPFALYYDDEKCKRIEKERDENIMRFTIELVYSTEGSKKV